MIDIIIGIIILIGSWRGLIRGAIKTTMSLVAWFLALALASRFAKPISFLLTDIATNSAMQIALAFVIIVFCVMIVSHIISWLLLKTLKVLRLGLLDRLLGGALGATVGFLKVLIILSVISPLIIHLPSWQDSSFVQLFLPFAPVAKVLIFETFGETWEQIQNFNLS